MFSATQPERAAHVVLPLQPAVTLTPNRTLGRERANELGYSNMDMLSGAGRDAMNVAPAGMIVVPCQGGLSHNEAESATPDDLAAGAHVLLHTLLSRALRSFDG